MTNGNPSDADVPPSSTTTAISVAPPVDYTVFIQTNLGSNLVMAFSSVDTVRDFKRKVATEHALSIPELGEITVLSLKVKHKESLFHLSDSLLVKRVFSGSEKPRFLHVDAIPAGVSENQARVATRNVLPLNSGQQESLQLRHNDSGNSDVLGNVPGTAHLCAKDDKLVNENDDLSDNNISVPDDVPPHVGKKQTENLPILVHDHSVPGNMVGKASTNKQIREKDVRNTSGDFLSGVEKHTDFAAGKMGVPESSVLLKTDLSVLKGQDGTKDEPTVERADVLSLRDEKYRKHGKSQIDDQPELLLKEKKKRKKGKGKISDEGHNQYSSRLPQVESEEHISDLGKQLLVDDQPELLLKEKKKWKKGKGKISDEGHNQYSSRLPQVESEEHIPDLGKQLLVENPEDKCEENAVASLMNLSVKPYDDGPSPQNLIGTKRRRKKSSKSLHTPDTALPSQDNDKLPSLDGEEPTPRGELHGPSPNEQIIALAAGHQVTEDNLKKPSENNNEDPGRKSGVTFGTKEAAHDLVHENPQEMDPRLPSNANKKSSRHRKKPTKSGAESSSMPPTEIQDALAVVNQVVEEISKQSFVDAAEEPDGKVDAVAINGEAAQIVADRNVAEVDPKVSSDAKVKNPSQRKKSSSSKARSSDPAPKEDENSLAGEKHAIDGKESLRENVEDRSRKADTAVINEAAAQVVTYENSGGVDPEIASDAKTKSLHHRRKKSAKHEPFEHEGKQASEYPGKRINVPATVEEANQSVACENALEEDPQVLDSAKIKKSQHRKNNTSVSQISTLEAIKCETLLSSPNKVTDKSSEPEAAINHHTEVTVQEVAEPGNSSENSPLVPSTNDDRGPSHSRKRPAKTDPSNCIPCNSDTACSTALDGKPNANIAKKESLPRGKHAERDTSVPSDVTGRKTRHSCKKSQKIEGYSLDVNNFEISTGRQITEDNSEKEPGNNHKDLSKDLDASNILQDAKSLGNPAKVQLAIPPNADDKCSSHVIKQSTDTEPLGNIYGKSVRETTASPLPAVAPQNDPAEDDGTDNLTELPKCNAEEVNTTELNCGKETTASHIPIVGTHKDPAEDDETDNHIETPKSDAEKVNFMEFFLPESDRQGLIASEGPTTMEDDTGKAQKEKSKSKMRARKSSSQDSSFDSADPLGLPDQDHQPKKSRLCELGNYGTENTQKQPVTKEVQASNSLAEKTDKKVGKSSKQPGSNKVLAARAHNEEAGKRLGKNTMPLGHDVASEGSHEQGTRARSIKQKSSKKKRNLPYNNDKKESIPSKVEASPAKVLSGSYAGLPGTSEDAPEREINVAPVASSDSTEDCTPYSGRYRVAVRKLPGRKLEKLSMDTIFDHVNSAGSDSSEGELHVDNERGSAESQSSDSSSSSGSDGIVEDAQTANAPRATVFSDSLGKGWPASMRGKKGIHGNQSSEGKLKLKMVLRNSSSYKKAKISASQSRIEDDEGQPVDIVLETQPDSF